MGKQGKNISKRIKTSHKKGIVKRKTAYTHVDPNLVDVNRFVNNVMEQKQKNVQKGETKI
jgi:isopropylmalate/homocitrate/citramalate synthase